MPNTINQHEGNTFYNYLTPVVRGSAGVISRDGFFYNFLETAYGPINGNWAGYDSITPSSTSGRVWRVRFPAPGLEQMTGAIPNGGIHQAASNLKCRAVLNFDDGWYAGDLHSYTLGNTINGGSLDTGSNKSFGEFPKQVVFAVANDYCFQTAVFSDSSLTSMVYYIYMGWLRDPAYNGDVFPRGLVAIYYKASNGYNRAVRVGTENAPPYNNVANLSIGNNSITNPPIVCTNETPGADATDVLIRENSAPNFAIGRLYNCVSLPNTAVIGQLWQNNGVDVDTGLPHTSPNTNKYLVVRSWGGRKLGMRIWSENYA